MCRKSVLLLLFATALMLCGCATLKKFVKKPTAEFVGMSMKRVSLFEATPVFKFKVTNPNPVGVTVSNISYDLKINDLDFAKSVLNEKITLESDGSGIVEVPVTVNYFDVFETVADFVQSDKVRYDLSGSVGVGPFAIPYQKKGEFDVPKLPKVSLKNVEVKDISLFGATMNFALEMKNANPFTVQLNELAYTLKLGGKEFAKGMTQALPPIDGKGGSTLEIPMNVNFIKLGRSVYNMLTGLSSEYDLSGSMKFTIPNVGEKSFPFQQSGVVPFHK